MIMRASIVMSTYTLERLRDIKDAVNSIAAQSNEDIETFIVLEDDQKLIDGITKALEGKPVKVVVSKTPGLTPARNLGIEKSTGDIVIFLDDDAIPSNNWVEGILEPYKDERILAVGGGIRPEWIGGRRPKWFPKELDWLVGSFYEGHPKKKAFVRNIIGANMSFRRRVFTEMGTFNTDIGAIGKKRISGDDSEFCMRLRKHYGPNHILYIPNAIVKHRVPPSRQTLGYSFRRSYVEGVSKAVINKLFKKDSSNQENLDTEYSFLFHVLFKGLPDRLNPMSKKKYKSRIGQFIILVSCTLLVFLGYLRGVLAPAQDAMSH